VGQAFRFGILAMERAEMRSLSAGDTDACCVGDRPGNNSSWLSGETPMADLQAVILCGGMGTRLSGTLSGLPKALAPVAGRPFLDYLLADLTAAGLRNVVLCTGHRSESIEAEYGPGTVCGLSVTYSCEHEPLGTAGALQHAAPQIHSSPFLLLNGDSLSQIDLPRLMTAHRLSGAVATIALARVAAADRYGSVAMDANGEIRAFSEKSKPADSSAAAGALINAGIYALDRGILNHIPLAPPAVSFEREILPRLIGRGLFGFVSDGFFIDIGVPEDYQRAQTEIPKRSSLVSPHTR
jgi:NDP-sugar pyrophosphorylase family protein